MKHALALGVAVMALALAAQAMVLESQVIFSCGSCSDCTDYLQNGSLDSGGTLELANGLTASGDCIDFGGSEGIVLDCSGNRITGDGTGTGIILSSGSNGNTVRNCINVSYFGTGISIVSSDDALVEDCGSFLNNNYGISLFTSSGSELLDSSASFNSIGIYGSPVSDSLISGANCSYNSGTGIRLQSASGNTVQGAWLIGNSIGIGLTVASSNNLTGITVRGGSTGLRIWEMGQGNVINDSGFYGQATVSLDLDAGAEDYIEGNLFYNNIFNSSGNFQSDDDVNNVNQWNASLDCEAESIIGGECIGGNYWTSPDGSGFSDSCAATEDWTCSSGHTLDSANTDWLPLAYYSAPPDTEPPVLALVSPTPDDGDELERSWVLVNASGDEGLDSCILDWNGTNMSMQVSGNGCWLNVTGLLAGVISFRVYGNDTQGNMNSTEERGINITPPQDTEGPVIDGFHVPGFVEWQANASLGINATDNTGIESVWALIEGPGGSRTVALENDSLTSWNATMRGLLNVTLYANDSSGNTASVRRIMFVNNSVVFNTSFLEADGESLEADWSLRLSSTGQVSSEGADDTEADESLIAGYYDFGLNALGGVLNLTINEASILGDWNGSVIVDHASGEGYGDIFAVEFPLDFDGAVLIIDYSDMGFVSEDSLTVYICEDWNMSETGCEGDWEEAEDVDNDEDGDVLIVEVDGFSAFGIAEEAYCGDGNCGAGEDPDSCPDDCTCEEGDTRPCSQEHEGICAAGTETCSGNEWTGCPAPSTEVCNQLDDDCDGTEDDVGGGFSVPGTKCQCFNGRSPVQEECNGVDDDCDGRIDEGSDCCVSGESRQCGPSHSTGECARGTAACEDNVWGECEGAVYPEEEVCGDGLDNDCDGQADEGCDFPDCPHGEIEDSCVCGGITESSGYCCSGSYSTEECQGSPWSLLIIIGVLILVVLAALMIIFRREGRELTWDELKNKYGSGQPPEKESTEEWT